VALDIAPDSGAAMTPTFWETFRDKRVLLLQGPVGPLFWRLSKLLRAAGAEVHRVNFNGGDLAFYPLRSINYRAPLDKWPQYLSELLAKLEIDVILIFGDCREMHRFAREVASASGVSVGAFEEGYVRPNYITLELSGVNGYSSIPRERDFYLSMPEEQCPPEKDVGNTFWYAAMWATLYYVFSALLRPFFPHYAHHRPLTILEAWPWIRSCWRKWLYRRQEREVIDYLTGARSRQFFLVPLQISTDSQVQHHSEFDSVPRFIRSVVESFARFAPPETMLAIKHHPLDRGYHDYASLIRALSETFNLGDRLLYIHDQHLPMLLNHTRGAVVINSTVGFTALWHGLPVKACGNAIYDIDGLTYQGPLDEYWRAADSFRPDMDLFNRFRTYVIRQTQVNGSLYRGGFADRVSGSFAWVTRRAGPVPPLKLATVNAASVCKTQPSAAYAGSWEATSSAALLRRTSLR
jgi:capsular polysaccharide export protein